MKSILQYLKDAKEILVYKKTKDDWLPSYTLFRKTEQQLQPLVVVSIHEAVETDEEPYWVVSVYGAELFGMCKEFNTEGLAQSVFLQIIALDYVNQEDLRALDFIGV